MKTTNVAILGSTSHIAKGLINNFLQREDVCLHLYTRSPENLLSFFDIIGKSPSKCCVIHDNYEDFTKCFYDVIINCVGVGTAGKLRGDYSRYFTVTEEYDNLAIGYVRDMCPDTLYISFSSGAVYGRELAASAEENTTYSIRVNHIATHDYYAIARLNAEAKHRAFTHLNIVDLRVFSYFSRFIDLTDGYFITDAINCILNKETLVTDAVNIVRDYVHPEDLFSIIRKCMDTGKINAALDVTSARPVSKKEILEYLSQEYGLQYEIGQSVSNTSATGSKNIYCSNYNNASSIGYKPAFSSMDAIKDESKHIINRSVGAGLKPASTTSMMNT